MAGNESNSFKELCEQGIGFHHAGLCHDDRIKVEKMFSTGAIRCLCTTSTLAVGVNLPAHLVVIKSTLKYGNRGYTEYSDLEILQMMGRAGRPQVSQQV